MEIRFLTNEIIFADRGIVTVSSKPVILRAMALGSCVALLVYERIKKISGLAHIMLPGRSPEKKVGNRMKYAEDAIDFLFKKIRGLGAKIKDTEARLFIEANVVRE